MTFTELSYRSRLPVSAAEALAWHARPGAFDRLTPPWTDVRVVDSSGTIADGDWKRLRLPVGPFAVDWTVAHGARGNEANGLGFLDEQVSGPFRSWRHEHHFEPVGDGECTLEDRLSYQLPAGAVGDALAGRRVRAELDEVFRFRHRRTQLDLERHANAGFASPQRIAVTGASGTVGRHLVAFLQAGGHDVRRLVRRPPAAADEIFWDPATGRIDRDALEGTDAVVHLAGEPIADRRWTGERKERILASRAEGTRLLALTLAGLSSPPQVLVSTSGVGYYGDGNYATLTETSPAGSGFLAGVCRAWEEATAPAAAAGVRVVQVRLGVVLAANGGLLARVARLFRFGLGGRLGSGEQYMSWIALDDLLGVLLRAIADEGLAGPVNATAPNPVTNRAFTEMLGRVLRRPTPLPAPAMALRLAAGELADELLLVSQRAVPERLAAAGFRFSFPSLEDALRHELGRHGGHRSADLAQIPVPSARSLSAD